MILPSKVVHVVPINDLRPHVEFCVFGTSKHPYCFCECQPEHQEIGVDEEITGMVVVHNSFDGREGVEWANEILK